MVIKRSIRHPVGPRRSRARARRSPRPASGRMKRRSASRSAASGTRAVPARAALRAARDREVDLDDVADHAEARRARRLDVARALARRRRSCCRRRTAAASRGRARRNAASRARVRSRSIEIAHVRGEEPVAVERRLAAPLDAAEHDGLHRGQSCTTMSDETDSRRCARRSPRCASTRRPSATRSWPRSSRPPTSDTTLKARWHVRAGQRRPARHERPLVGAPADRAQPRAAPVPAAAPPRRAVLDGGSYGMSPTTPRW